jgi:signal peptidase I
MSNFLTKEQIPISWRLMAENSLCYVYNGSSMLPTFHPGQFLLVTPLTHMPGIGDVIIFSDPSRDRNVVHRVISASGDFLRTRGDNNSRVDAAYINIVQVIGKVEHGETSGHLRPVMGGWRGLWRARIRWGALFLDNLVRRIFWRPYQMLRNSGQLARVWRPEIVRLHLQNENGLLVKYIHKQRSVATWFPLRKVFECRKPYDLVIPPPEGIEQ